MKFKNIFFVLLFILLILIKGYLFSTKYTSNDENKEYIVFIESLKSASDIKVSYNVKVLNTSDKFILNLCDNSYDNIKTDLSLYTNYKYGDVIKVKGKISIPQKLNNPGEFNYKQYLYSDNIHGLINTYEIPERVPYNLNFIQKIYSKIYMFKAHVKSIIQNSMRKTNANVATSMIYGDTTDLDETIKEDFEAVGVSHLMSVSGTHITSFMMIINLILGIRKNKKKKDKVRKDKQKQDSKTKKITIAIIQIISICVYLVFTGFSVSVLRAGIMLIITIICNTLNIKNSKYKSIGVALLLISLHTPYAIFNTGMRLSFLATLGIIMFWKYIAKLFTKITSKIKNEVIKKIVTFLIENISITLSVQLMIIPIQMQVFNKLPFPVVVPNLILGIVSIPIRVVGIVGIMMSFVPSIASKIFWIVEMFVKILIACTNIFKTISFSMSTSSMPLVFFVLYYICILSIFVYFKLKNIQDKEGRYSLKKLLKYLKIFILILAILLIIIVIAINVYSIYLSKYVYFFNVEQGDMSYVKCGTESVIVDIGSMRQGLAFNTISNYFKTSNLNKVDAVIISHMHKDHINGLENLLHEYQVGMVIYSKPRTVSETYTNFKKMLSNYNVTQMEVKAGDKIIIGKIKIEVLLPKEEYITKDEINANSLVCKITVNNKELLYMGDANKEAEEKIIKQSKAKSVDIKDIYILKVGHHGSKTATGEKFIQKIRPEHAVISALKKYYGHPHENTTDTLRENNIYTYLTEKQGAVKFSLK